MPVRCDLELPQVADELVDVDLMGRLVAGKILQMLGCRGSAGTVASEERRTSS